MSSLTWRISAESAVFPGQHHTRSGIPSRVTAIPITTWGRSSRWSLDLPQVRNPAVRSSPPSGVVPAGDGAAVLVAGNRVVGVLRDEVGAGRVEEQQVDLEAEQVRDPVEDLLLQGAADLQQPVHRPVARVVSRLRQARDQDVLAGPAGRGQLRGRGQRPVRGQREQHPLRRGVQPPALQQAPHRRADAQPLPQRVQRPGAAQRPGLRELQPLRAAAAPCPGPGAGRPTRPAAPAPPASRAPPGRSCTRPAPATASRPGPTRCGPAAGTGPRCRPCSAAASTASTRTRQYAAKPAPYQG